MKSFSLRILLFLVVIGAIWFTVELQFDMNNAREQADREERATFALQALELEFMKTVDPSLGLVPSERLFVAREAAAQLKLAKRAGANEVTTDWVERGPSNVGGRTRALMFDPNDPMLRTVWAGSASGGLWKNTDTGNRGQPWELVDDRWNNLAVTTLAYDPKNTQVFYAGTGEGYGNLDAVRGGGIFKSEDGGATWMQLPSTFNGANPLNAQRTFSHIQKIVVHPDSSHILAATRTAGVQRCGSPCEGAIGGWRNVLGAGAPASDLEIGTDGTIYAGVGLWSDSRIYRSTDRGLTWDTLGVLAGGTMPPKSRRIELAVAPSDPDVVYALVAHSVEEDGESATRVQGLYRSENKGDTWTKLASPDDRDGGIPDDDFSRGQAWYDLALAVDPRNSHHVITGAVDLFKSKDGGASWTQISIWKARGGISGFFDPAVVHADHHAITFRPDDSDVVVFGHDGGISFTVDATADQPTFFEHNKSYNVTQFYSVALNPDAGSNVMIAGAQDNGTQRFDGRGVDVTDEVKAGDGGFAFIDQDDSHIAIASYINNNFARSTDSGQNFSSDIISDRGTGIFINPADYDDRENILYTARNETSIYRVRNVVDDPTDAEVVNVALGSTASHIRVSPYAAEETTTLFVGTSRGRVYKIRNAHAVPSLTEITPRTGGYPIGRVWVSSIDIGEDEKRLLLTLSNYGVTSIWESRDGGASWVNREGTLPDVPVRWGMYNPHERKEAIVATDAGVWETLDIGAARPTWTPVVSLPIVRVDMLQYRGSDRAVVAATHGRGLWTARMGLSIGDVDVALVLDRSASMDSLNYMVPAKTAAKAFIGLMRLDDYAAVTSFSNSVSVDYPLQKLATEARRSAVQAAVDGIATGGYTTIGGGIQRGLIELNKGRIENVQTMVLLTDGKENQRPYVVDVLPTVPDSTSIHTIGLGTDADQALLQIIALQTGGSYNFAPAPGNMLLQQIYDDVRMLIDNTKPIARTSGSVETGTVRSVDVPVDASVAKVQFRVYWTGETTPLVSVTSPTAAVYEGGAWTRGDGYASVEITGPEDGIWRVDVAPSTDAAAAIAYVVSASGSTPIGIVPELPPISGGPVRVGARLVSEDGVATTGIGIEASILVPTRVAHSAERLYQDGDQFVDADGAAYYRTIAVPLYDDGAHDDGLAGDGVFAAVLDGVGAAGTYVVEFTAVDAAGRSTADIARRARGAFVLPAASDGEAEVATDHPGPIVSLSQNYPNPFSNRSEIAFRVGTATRATLTLYAIDGRRVAVLYDEEVDAGTEIRAPVDASGLAAGVYTYVLEAAGHRVARQLVIHR